MAGLVLARPKPEIVNPSYSKIVMDVQTSRYNTGFIRWCGLITRSLDKWSQFSLFIDELPMIRAFHHQILKPVPTDDTCSPNFWVVDLLGEQTSTNRFNQSIEELEFPQPPFRSWIFIFFPIEDLLDDWETR